MNSAKSSETPSLQHAFASPHPSEHSALALHALGLQGQARDSHARSPYTSLMVTSTSTPGSIAIEVICLTTSAGECKSIKRLWILHTRESTHQPQVLMDSPETESMRISPILNEVSS